MDLETSIKSLRLAWLGRLLVVRSSPRQAFVNHLLKDRDGISYLGAIMTLMNSVLIQYFTKNSFSGGLILEQNFPQSLQFLNNKNIKVDWKTICYPLYVEAGFLICKHVLLNMTNLESYNCAKRKRLEVNENELWSLEFQCGEKVFNPLTSKSKHFYELLISKKVRVSRGFTKWKENFCLDDTAVSEAFLMVRSISSETFVRRCQFKILNNITFTNHRLAKIGYAQNDLCTFCGVESETLYHLFYECSFTSQKKFPLHSSPYVQHHSYLGMQTINVTKCPPKATPQVRKNSCIYPKLKIRLSFMLTLLFGNR